MVLFLRIPIYLIVGAIEGYIIYALRKNKYFMSQLEKILRK